ncbi:MAG: sugar phosphate isomerase/epimerase [Phycisphaeraceae bacterium]|nr:sugar phosphate isomerase/epimerase [Phycisphaeraceae bacterium]
MTPHNDIRIGTMAGKGDRTADYLRQIAPLGFECFQINFWKTLPTIPLEQLAGDVRRVLDDAGLGQTVSSLGMFGNPLIDPAAEQGWHRCIDAAEKFDTKLICGFAGGVEGKSVPDSMPRFAEVFGPIVQRAADKGIRIAFENCPMGSTWHLAKMNIAYCPAAWELIFNAVPAENLGLEWEPCHQMCQLIEPLAQLRQWVDKVFHLHGKDATIDHAMVATHGIASGKPFARHRTPGFGDTNWYDVISILRMAGFRGSIDIEGWHDPVYRDELEMTGQVHALTYLQQCRGGAFVPNPKGFD